MIIVQWCLPLKLYMKSLMLARNKSFTVNRASMTHICRRSHTIHPGHIYNYLSIFRTGAGNILCMWRHCIFKNCLISYWWKIHCRSNKDYQRSLTGRCYAFDVCACMFACMLLILYINVTKAIEISIKLMIRANF